MSNERRKTPPMRPFLSTQEFLQAAGISMQTLRSYEKAGICMPVAKSDNGYYKYYSLGQCQTVKLAEIMRHGGKSIADTSKAYQQGTKVLLEETLKQCTEDIRTTRRNLKSAVNYRRHCDDLLAVGETKGFYLRYVPQRWMALIPLREGHASLPSDEQFLKAFERLKGVVEVVGWCAALSFGTLVSTSYSLARASSYAFLELASPPMPCVSGSLIVDGGCYQHIDPVKACMPCKTSDCAFCARFGRQPTTAEKDAWESAARTNPGQWDRTIMAESLSEPYATGTWRRYTQGLFKAQEGEDNEHGEAETPHTSGNRKGSDRRESLDGPTGSGTPEGSCKEDDADRPRLMPHQVRLPFGVTACEMPAGVYLCKQCKPDEKKEAFAAVASEATHLDRTLLPIMPANAPSNARKTQQQNQSRRRKPGPFVEPFVAPRAKGDPNMAGWWCKADKEKLARVQLIANAALSAKEDFVVILADMQPLPDKANITGELQVFVDAQKIPPPSKCFVANPNERGINRIEESEKTASPERSQPQGKPVRRKRGILWQTTARGTNDASPARSPPPTGGTASTSTWATSSKASTAAPPATWWPSETTP